MIYDNESSICCPDFVAISRQPMYLPIYLESRDVMLLTIPQSFVHLEQLLRSLRAELIRAFENATTYYQGALSRRLAVLSAREEWQRRSGGP